MVIGDAGALLRHPGGFEGCGTVGVTSNGY